MTPPREAVCGLQHFTHIVSGRGRYWERQLWDSPTRLPQGLLPKGKILQKGLLCPVSPSSWSAPPPCWVGPSSQAVPATSPRGCSLPS